MDNDDIEYHRKRAKLFSSMEGSLAVIGSIFGLIGIFSVNTPLILFGGVFVVLFVAVQTIADKNTRAAKRIEKESEDKRLAENRTANLLEIRAEYQSICHRIDKPDAPLQIGCDGHECDFWLAKDRVGLHILQRLEDAEDEISKADAYIELYYKNIPVSEIRYFTYRTLNTGRLLTDIVISSNEVVTVSEDAYNELVYLLPEKELKTQKPTVVHAQNVIPPIMKNIHVCPICPKCGSHNTRVITGTDKVVSTVAFGVFAANKVLNQYVCNDCKHKFS